MATLTTEQLARFRRKIDDNGTPPALTDTELNDIWTESGENFNKSVRDALVEIWTSVAKFNTYTIGQTQERRDQIFRNLGAVIGYYDDVTLKQSDQVKIAGMRSVPPRIKDKPSNG